MISYLIPNIVISYIKFFSMRKKFIEICDFNTKHFVDNIYYNNRLIGRDGTGFCHATSEYIELFIFNFIAYYLYYKPNKLESNELLKYYPELAKYKPEKNEDGAYWFERTDRARRISILDEIIESLYSKMNWFDRFILLILKH